MVPSVSEVPQCVVHSAPQMCSFAERRDAGNPAASSAVSAAPPAVVALPAAAALRPLLPKEVPALVPTLLPGLAGPPDRLAWPGDVGTTSGSAIGVGSSTASSTTSSQVAAVVGVCEAPLPPPRRKLDISSPSPPSLEAHSGSHPVVPGCRNHRSARGCNCVCCDPAAAPGTGVKPSARRRAKRSKGCLRSPCCSQSTPTKTEPLPTTAEDSFRLSLLVQVGMMSAAARSLSLCSPLPAGTEASPKNSSPRQTSNRMSRSCSLLAELLEIKLRASAEASAATASTTEGTGNILGTHGARPVKPPLRIFLRKSGPKSEAFQQP
mmetsp:Transcript_130358/g.325197  ORF Transcript_130358/g.325197 Transcript_130358/m.325197 type:complete len:322 (-) Transcript_130358:778-1743(-)